MKGIALENGSELLASLGYALVTTVLTGLGIEAELFGVRTLGSGDPILAAWFLAFGAIALYVGLYVVGYEKLLPTIRGTPN